MYLQENFSPNFHKQWINSNLGFDRDLKKGEFLSRLLGRERLLNPILLVVAVINKTLLFSGAMFSEQLVKKLDELSMAVKKDYVLS